jgi:hypothetical protein
MTFEELLCSLFSSYLLVVLFLGRSQHPALDKVSRAAETACRRNDTQIILAGSLVWGLKNIHISCLLGARSWELGQEQGDRKKKLLLSQL